MYKILVLMGKSASGKDTILRNLKHLCPDLHEIVSCTTRPPRDYEKNGIDYHFINPDDFNDKDFIEYVEFRGWYYGTRYEDLSKEGINLGIFNPAGVRKLLENPNVQAKVFYVTANDKIRLERQLGREHDPDVAEICRRYFADEKDFSELEFEHTIIENNGEALPLEEILHVVDKGGW